MKQIQNATIKIANYALVTCASMVFCQYSLAAIPIQHWTQPSGAKIYLVESPAIAMLDVQIDFDGGGRRDPLEKAGLASVTAGLLSSGVAARSGAPALDENALGEAWADLGAQFGSSAGADRMSFSLRTLTEPDLLKQAVELAARQIGEPSFPEKIWLRDRQKIIASLKESYTRPASVAGRAYAKAVYSGHPYGYDATEETLGRISTVDMRAFYTSAVAVCRARISMVGAVTRAQADGIALKLLARLPQTGCSSLAALPPVPDVPALAQPVEQVIKFDAAQAQVLLGQPGYKRSDPDFFTMLVGNYILGGGGFVSRLSSEVLICEQDPVLVDKLKALQLKLKATMAKIERGDGVSLLRRLVPGSMQLVFLDPPFESAFFEAAIKAAGQAISDSGFVYLEAPKPWTDAELSELGVKVHKFGKAGAVHFHLLVKSGAGD